MSKRRVRMFDDDEQCKIDAMEDEEELIDAVTDLRLKDYKCEDCEWGWVPGECKEYVEGGRCDRWTPSFQTFQDVRMEAEEEVHAGVWVRIK